MNPNQQPDQGTFFTEHHIPDSPKPIVDVEPVPHFPEPTSRGSYTEPEIITDTTPEEMLDAVFELISDARKNEGELHNANIEDEKSHNYQKFFKKAMGRYAERNFGRIPTAPYEEKVAVDERKKELADMSRDRRGVAEYWFINLLSREGKSGVIKLTGIDWRDLESDTFTVAELEKIFYQPPKPQNGDPRENSEYVRKKRTANNRRKALRSKLKKRIADQPRKAINW